MSQFFSAVTWNSSRLKTLARFFGFDNNSVTVTANQPCLRRTFAPSFRSAGGFTISSSPPKSPSSIAETL